MKVLFVTSECAPYAKVGGLGDVIPALAKALEKKGVEVKIFMPRYYDIDKQKFNLKAIPGALEVTLGEKRFFAEIYEGVLPKSGVKVYFLEYEALYGRSGIYGYGNEGFKDNDLRYVLLTKASFEFAKKIGFNPDIFHFNDWQSAVGCMLLNTRYAYDFPNSASVFTIHNMQHQGKFSKEVFSWLEVEWSHFNMYEIEDYGGVNLLKSGIYHSDAITTVSPTYAKEIQTPDFGWGLHEMLKYYSYKLFGILNGVDLHEWNPKTDRYIFQNYDENTWHRKKENKKALQKEMGLEEKDVPLIGFVGRLVEQKGIGLIAGMLERFLNGFDAQFVFLGSGESWAEGFLRSMEYKYPQKLKAYIGFNNALAHKIEAGSDIFLMPSLFEPCGLNQMYSQIYGTPPLVRATGGLEDTVENYNPDTKSGSGFKFYEPSSQALFNTLKWALETYYTQDFETIAKNGMKKDFSWDKSAGNYIDVYNWALLSKKLRRGK